MADNKYPSWIFDIFDQPTNRPDEPSTTGLDEGEGAGSEVLHLPPVPDDDEIAETLDEWRRSL